MNATQDKEQLRTGLLAFLDSIARPGFEPSSLSDDCNLVEEGVLDSLALIQIIFYLEQNFGINP